MDTLTKAFSQHLDKYQQRLRDYETLSKPAERPLPDFLPYRQLSNTELLERLPTLEPTFFEPRSDQLVPILFEEELFQYLLNAGFISADEYKQCLHRTSDIVLNFDAVESLVDFADTYDQGWVIHYTTDRERLYVLKSDPGMRTLYEFNTTTKTFTNYYSFHTIPCEYLTRINDFLVYVSLSQPVFFHLPTRRKFELFFWTETGADTNHTYVEACLENGIHREVISAAVKQHHGKEIHLVYEDTFAAALKDDVMYLRCMNCIYGVTATA